MSFATLGGLIGMIAALVIVSALIAMDIITNVAISAFIGFVFTAVGMDIGRSMDNKR